MADSQREAGADNRNERPGWPRVKVLPFFQFFLFCGAFSQSMFHFSTKAILFENKYDSLLWLLRLYCIGCTLFYLVPLFGAQFSANCYRRVILSSATISALRLHQRLPRFQFSRVFFAELVQEDAFHYLCYSVIFLFAHSATLVLIPVTMFAILHVAKFTGRIMDAAGSNNFLVTKLRPLVFKIENRETQQMMLQFIASSEIMMMPITALMLLSGQASFLVPFFYYRFVQLRYTSRRNPYSRLMFSQMRLGIEQLAYSPRCPAIVSRFLTGFVSFVARLAPGIQAQAAS